MSFIRVISASAVAAVAFAASAAAQCYTSADLTRGLQVRFENGDYTTFKRTNDGFLDVTENYSDGSNPILFRAWKGVYFTSEHEIDAMGNAIPGTRLDIEFESDVTRLPEPYPGVSWTGPTVNIFEAGGSRNEVTTATFSAHPDVTLSGCDYEAVQVDLRYDWGADGGLDLVYIYLPAIGTAYIRSNQFDRDTLNSTSAVALEPMTK
ncbi:hypothetical protein [Wenxinia marina]|uniref:Uncharacterized protein n=1 Tax=Wenxinia marina DSM 24838 TaxID=1123501 RepID=A0A0D0QCE1_9RHOB|nr:hypothetical protein [Wenxinia marina]KIQ68608.1 hypothetical protein Wenmar_02879 [Wenxinia marina DSM 24838]GGL67258.1 hypothetical protein GCM10011392_22220 [Wenxinia marina]